MDTSSAPPAEPVASPSKAIRERIDALNDEAWPLRFTDRLRAESLARKALDLAEAGDYKVGIALALRTMGISRYYFASDHEGAHESLQRALALLDAAGETRGRADVLGGVGLVYQGRGEYAEATRLHLQALQLHRATGNVVGEARSLNNLGVVASHMGEYAAALEYHQASLAISELQQNEAAVGSSLMNIGAVYGHLGEMERSLEHTVRALRIHERSDRPAAAICLHNIGTTFRVLCEHDSALEYLEQAAAAFRALGNVGEANSLCEIGCVHQVRGNDAAALSYFISCRVSSLRVVGAHGTLNQRSWCIWGSWRDDSRTGRD